MNYSIFGEGARLPNRRIRTSLESTQCTAPIFLKSKNISAAEINYMSHQLLSSYMLLKILSLCFIFDPI